LSAIIGTKLSVPVLILSQVVLGIVMGCIFSFVIGKLLKNYSLESDGLYAVFMASIILVTYAATDLLGGMGIWLSIFWVFILAIWSLKAT